MSTVSAVFKHPLLYRTVEDAKQFLSAHSFTFEDGLDTPIPSRAGPTKEPKAPKETQTSGESRFCRDNMKIAHLEEWVKLHSYLKQKAQSWAWNIKKQIRIWSMRCIVSLNDLPPSFWFSLNSNMFCPFSLLYTMTFVILFSCRHTGSTVFFPPLARHPMTVGLFSGCILVAYAVPAAVLWGLVLTRAQLFIIAISRSSIVIFH